MLPTWILCMLLACFVLNALSTDADSLACQPVPVSKVPPGCQHFTKVCIDQSIFIFHDDQYDWKNPNSVNPPDIHVADIPVAWQAGGDSNTDAAKAHPPLHHLYHARPKTAAEPTPELQNPSFSNCTLPIILYTTWMYNLCEYMRHTVSKLHFWKQAGLVTDQVTYVLSTPLGLELYPFHSLLLQPYSQRAVASLADFSRRPIAGHQVNWTGDGTMQQCFQNILICRLAAPDVAQYVLAAGQAVVSDIQQDIPANPLGFTEGSDVLKVLIETRTGGVRNILNAHDLAESCADIQALQPHKKVECKAFTFAQSLPLSREQFLTNLGAVRSADITLMVHGSGAANMFFARKGTALVEVRPCEFGTVHGGWPDLYYPKILEQGKDEVLFFALNIEDKSLCKPGIHEAELQQGKGHSQAIPSYWARDRHVSVPVDIFAKLISHVSQYVGNITAYQQLRADRKQNYALLEAGLQGRQLKFGV